MARLALLVCHVACAGASMVMSTRAVRGAAGARAACAMTGVAEDSSIRLTGDTSADKMILAKLGSGAKIRREDMVAAKGRSLADLALGNTAEWKRAVDKARSDAVTAVRVRHILVETRELAEVLRGQLREGARFDELAAAVSTCAVTREKGGEIGWSGVNDEHLDEYFPKSLREVALGVKPGDVVVEASSFGVHVLQVVDVFQTLMIESNQRTRALPGSGVQPQPLINLLRQGRTDDRGFKQLVGTGSSSADDSAGPLMHNSGKSSRMMRYSMDSMGCQMNTADAERMEGQLQALGFQKADSAADAQVTKRA